MREAELCCVELCYDVLWSFECVTLLFVSLSL
jgi:hypothetical protein